MTTDHVTARLLLTSEICQQLQLYAQEITREEPTRAYLESFASRALKRCAELYTLSRPDVLGAGVAQPVSPASAANVLPLRSVFNQAPSGSVSATETEER